ncbi:phosphoserine transaminase [Flavobacteriaceae bacterium UJ101]|nr:phosphoserine transaminase [Flavobacteriaceae bacterium UJ101]
MKKYNFSAGPCILPQEVLSKASDSVKELNNSGLSLIEISHRSKDFVEVMEKARSLVKELLNVPEGYSVLFLQGGASLQFIMTPYNFLKIGGKASYINTGTWSDKAVKEAKKIGEVVEVASSKDQNFNYIPKEYTIPEDSDYIHITSNNTIFGTQFKTFPKTDKVLICDMSSDIFSRKINVSDFGMIYAGAQKNMGPAGATLVIVKDELLGHTGRDIPSYLDYKVHIDKDSMFNTPPVFSVYTSMLTLEWLKSKGGVEAIEKINNEKATLLYDEVDRNPLFEGVAAVEDRSMMNVTFVLKNQEHQALFDSIWEAKGVSGIKGHRSVGGYRASIYNGMPQEGIEVLVAAMKELELNS